MVDAPTAISAILFGEYTNVANPQAPVPQEQQDQSTADRVSFSQEALALSQATEDVQVVAQAGEAQPANEQESRVPLDIRA